MYYYCKYIASSTEYFIMHMCVYVHDYCVDKRSKTTRVMDITTQESAKFAYRECNFNWSFSVVCLALHMQKMDTTWRTYMYTHMLG